MYHPEYTWLTGQGELHDEEIGQVILDSEFEYLHLSEDKTTAVFKMDSGAEDYHPVIRERLQRFESVNFEDPQHTVQIRHDLTDGPLPGLSLDYQNFHLSCNWRELFTAFYAEIGLCSRLDIEFVKSQESWAAGLRQRMERGEFDMMAMLEKVMSGFAVGTGDNLKKVRRARIRRQFKEVNIEWKGDDEYFQDIERENLKALAQKRQFIGMEEYSDNGEEEEDGSSEEQSDEEWEDEEDEGDVDV
jgi:hypothetical protein